MRPRAEVSGRLDGRTFQTLLARLGSDSEAAAQQYAAIHQRLVEYFDRRGAPAADVLADQTLDRVAVKLREGKTIENLPAFCYGVARNVLYESERARVREGAAIAEAAAQRGREALRDNLEAEADCLARCLGELPSENRELILAYYRQLGKTYIPERKALATNLAMTYTALKARAHRVRAVLAECLERCLKGA